MRTCQSCGRRTRPTRLLQCGEYLRWEPTGVVQAITPEVRQRPRQSAPPASRTRPPGPRRPGASRRRPRAVRTHGSPRPARPAAAPPRGARAVAAARAPKPRRRPLPQRQARRAGRASPRRIVLRLPDGDADRGQTLRYRSSPASARACSRSCATRAASSTTTSCRSTACPTTGGRSTPTPSTSSRSGPAARTSRRSRSTCTRRARPRPRRASGSWRSSPHSKAQASAPAASAPLALGIEPYTETQTKIRPERVKGRRKALFDVAVQNSANAPVLVALDGSDPDGEMDFAFNRPPQEIGPGHSVNVGMRVKPPRQHWVGRPLEHRLQVTTITGDEAAERLAAEPLPPEVLTEAAPPRRRGLLRRRKVPASAGGYAPRVYKPQVHPPGMSIGPGGLHMMGGSFKAPRVQAPKVPKAQIKPGNLKLPSGGGAPAMPLMPNQAMFRQKAWIGWWVLPLLLLLAIAAIVVYLLLPKNVTVPKVVGAKTSFDAEKTLTGAGLTLTPTSSSRSRPRSRRARCSRRRRRPARPPRRAASSRCWWPSAPAPRRCRPSSS